VRQIAVAIVDMVERNHALLAAVFVKPGKLRAVRDAYLREQQYDAVQARVWMKHHLHREKKRKRINREETVGRAVEPNSGREISLSAGDCVEWVTTSHSTKAPVARQSRRICVHAL